ncbi:uncharacterized protein LAESUDRAFT_719851 [Laetiporus sulphureus 93-53]|uniref:G-patch domain-containing protein n=1 Tax=Laetiporus sulphureus 93-53 TaxID=1314785 RepID=A0A165HM06_9APHY|nr:uncharacterized protein LAESUDRAFT_719851 [Laetiporus sulphureus 93-53]KZT11909.1 hypothetical protein LAESUDRAFT_719851 [Laetiporus sulphureus 93-53]
MATVTHYIYSHYDPAERPQLEQEAGQIPEEEEKDAWQTESSFGAQRRLAAAPRFVRGIVSYDEINDMMSLPSTLQVAPEEKANTVVSSWYRSLMRSASAPLPLEETETLLASSFTTSCTTAASSVGPSSPAPTSRKRESRNKDNWFITRALRSEPPTTCPTPTPTLADILAREPPPLPNDQPYTPPVFLTLGPNNRGYTMLQQSGWSEGEPLGPGVVRRPRVEEPIPQIPIRARREAGRMVVKKEEREIKCDPDGEISELREVDIIDLTLSDSEDGEENVKMEEVEEEVKMELGAVPASLALGPSEAAPSSHNPRALLTPLPTVLKSDRLGVGLKAKTVGPYKASKKRVTHNAAALAEHIRATEEMRRMKTLVGRGSKSFARLAKAEAESRRRVLASLKKG